MKKYLFTTLIILSGPIFFDCDAQSQFSGWLASFNTIKISDKKSFHLDAQLRSTDEIRQVQTFLFRPGINFQVKKDLVFTVGYAFISNKNTINNITDYFSEHRLWEQLLYSHKLKSISIAHRFRFEQRFLPRIFSYPDRIETDGFMMAGRIRYFFRGVVPMKKQNTFTKGLFAALQNEVFVNFIDKHKVNGKFFDQNRLYLATGYRLSPKADIEIGYLNQYVNGRGSQFTKNHVLQAAAYIRL